MSGEDTCHGIGIASAASSGLKLVGAAVRTNAVNQFANSLGGQMAFGGVIGGLTESAMGGNFFHGFATGAIVSGLNHGLHTLYKNNQRAYQEMYKQSKDGKERFGWVTKEGIVVLNSEGNTSGSAGWTKMPLKYNSEGSVTHVKINPRYRKC